MKQEFSLKNARGDAKTIQSLRFWSRTKNLKLYTKFKDYHEEFMEEER
jgi:hypothetical protein